MREAHQTWIEFRQNGAGYSKDNKKIKNVEMRITKKKRKLYQKIFHRVVKWASNWKRKYSKASRQGKWNHKSRI